jgi:hypothetical protein
MRHQRFVQISTSDDEEALLRQQQHQPQSLNSEDKSQPRWKSLKRLKPAEEKAESKEKKRKKGREASKDEEMGIYGPILL